MNYYKSIKHAKDSITGEQIFEEIEKKVFFENYYCSVTDRFVPLANIIKIIGTDEQLQRIIDVCKRWIQHYDLEMVIVSCYMHPEEIQVNPKVQKLLNFQLNNVKTGITIMVGGIVFQHNDMTLHT